MNHSDELELLKQVADEYAWEAIETEVEPKFKEVSLDFRDRQDISCKAGSVISDRLGQPAVQLSFQAHLLSTDEDRTIILTDERAFQDEACLQAWCW